MFETILGIAGIGLSLYGLLTGQAAAAEQQAINEKMARSNLRLQYEENKANLGLLDQLLQPAAEGETSLLEQSYELQTETYKAEGLSQFTGLTSAITSAKAGVRAAKGDITAAEEQKAQADVIAAARGQVGGAASSVGAVGRKLDTKTAEARTVLGERETAVTQQEDLMKAYFGEDMSFDLVGGIYGAGYEQMLANQELEKQQIQSQYDILGKTQKEIENQYGYAGGDPLEMTDPEAYKKKKEEEKKIQEEFQNMTPITPLL